MKQIVNENMKIERKVVSRDEGKSYSAMMNTN